MTKKGNVTAYRTVICVEAHVAIMYHNYLGGSNSYHSIANGQSISEQPRNRCFWAQWPRKEIQHRSLA